MDTPSDPGRQKLIDPVVLAQAGRHFREWLERLLQRAAAEPDTSIAWESGEPDDDAPPPAR